MSKTQRPGTPSIKFQMKIRFLLTGVYLAAFVAANLLVKYFGPYGLWFSSLFLIPFDFVCRCVFNEVWKGFELIAKLAILTVCSCLLTVLINMDAVNIAKASMAGFVAAQVFATIFYQIVMNRSYFLKVNMSDLLAICVDSFVFQFVAFGILDWKITLGQVVIKGIGGLIWFYIIFTKFRLHEKINRSREIL